ncbi:MAG TPA: AMP-binding protein [Micromonosporaceae bacterium]|nr:AMP-binding protein [Micromonosporaceae bacterium]
MLTLPPDLDTVLSAVPFARDLDRHEDRAALISQSGVLTYRQLAALVETAARQLGPCRRLVLLTASNTVDSVVCYLAALSAGHPLLLVPAGNPGHVEAMIAKYDPDVVITGTGQSRIQERRLGTGHKLHPELALLLSTSGSTGAPKLVRLSHRNLQSNAEAIAEYLDIRDGDRAATTLPMHYCYGLSVLNSHLQRGAALILTDLSVVDQRFWDLFREQRGTSFAGVPYTFELLDQVGFDRIRLPHLRYITQAGGRLASDRVRRYTELGRAAGWQLIVMYGQTEATARMAYLPPHLAENHHAAIGVPIPGGSFRLDPVPGHPEPDTGELIYSGPNVMLGYAETLSDLSLGRTVRELRTGDVVRRGADGVYEIVGRRSGFLKILGHRIDLEWVESQLARHGLESCCAGTDSELVVAVQGCDDPAAVRRLIARGCGLPPHAVRIRPVAELPRLDTGKPDRQAVLRMPPTPEDRSAEPRSCPTPSPGDTRRASTAGLRALYAEILDRPEVADECSFVGLGGDSLSYVELSVRLEKRLGRLPTGWHTMSIRDLHRAGQAERRRLRMLETSVALRAIAIVLIVGSHIKLFAIVGGAHLLLGLAGYNFARFQLCSAEQSRRVRHLWRSIGRIAVPTAIWVAGALMLTNDYGLPNAFLLNSLLGPRGGRSEWHFWFVEALVYILVALAVLLAMTPFDRLERRVPFGLPMGLLGIGLVIRYDLLGIADRDIPSALRVFWLFMLGWAGAKATKTWQRAVASAAVAVTVPGFFGQPEREAIIIVGMLLLLWLPSLPGLPGLNWVAAVLASGSLYIYVTHWQVFPLLAGHSKVLALLVSLGVGVGYAIGVARVSSAIQRRGARLRRRRPPIETTAAT